MSKGWMHDDKPDSCPSLDELMEQIKAADTTTRAMQAAPDMLELLKVLAHYDNTDESGSCPYCENYLNQGEWHRTDCPITRAREIIKKVEGGK